MDDSKKLEKVKRIYSFWGKFSYLYDLQDLFTFLGKAKQIRSEAVKRLGLRNDDKVLEVACGSGRNFQYFFNYLKGDIYGLDYSNEMLDAARKLSLKHEWDIKLFQGDAAKFKFKTKFDGIISVLGISAVPDWKTALKNCKSHLKKGGKLVVCDARLFTNNLKFLNPILSLIYTKFAAWDPSKDIIKELNLLFSDVKIKNYNFGTFYIAVATKS